MAPVATLNVAGMVRMAPERRVRLQKDDGDERRPLPVSVMRAPREVSAGIAVGSRERTAGFA